MNNEVWSLDNVLEKKNKWKMTWDKFGEKVFEQRGSKMYMEVGKALEKAEKKSEIIRKERKLWAYNKKNLTEAIKFYKSPGGQLILQAAIKKENIVENHYISECKNMMLYYTNAGIYSPRVLYRGGDLRQVMEAFSLKSLYWIKGRIGAEEIIPGLISTTTRRRVAQKYAQECIAPAIWRIKPRGKFTALHITVGKNSEEEDEYVIPDGSWFKLTGFKRVKGFTLVDLELVGPLMKDPIKNREFWREKCEWKQRGRCRID